MGKTATAAITTATTNAAANITITTSTTTTTTTTATTTTAAAARLLKFCPLFNSQDNRTYSLFLFLFESTSPKTRPGLQARTWILQIPHQCTDMAGSSKHMHRRGCSPPNSQFR